MKIPRPGRPAALALALVMALAGAAAEPARADVLYTSVIDVADDGGGADLADLLRRASILATLAEQPPAALSGLERRIDADRQRLDAALRSEGYYDGAVAARLDPSVSPAQVTITVTPGPRYGLAAPRLGGDADRLDGLTAAELLAALDLPAGGPARAGDVLGAETRLLDRLRRGGYPFAAIERRVVVDHDRRVMEPAFTIAAGPLARFGPTQVEGAAAADVSETLILGRLPWRPGDRYAPELLDKARKDIAALGVFDAVSVVLADGRTPPSDGVVPVTVRTAPRLRRFIGASAVYSTADGLGLKGWWGHRNLLGGAERLRIEGEAAQLGQRTAEAGGLNRTDFTLGASLEVPDFLVPQQSLTLALRGVSENPVAYQRRAQIASARLERRLDERWTVQGAVEQEIAWVQTNDADYHVAMLGLPLAAGWDGSNDLLDPTDGARLSADLALWTPLAGHHAAGFVIAGAGARLYRDLTGDGWAVLAARLEGAMIVARDLSDVPPHRRLYAGGGGSVRGFARQMAGPRDAWGDPTGGLSRIDGGVEMRLKTTDVISIVPFFDAALVSRRSVGGYDDGVRAGAGLGMRYHTGFGPLRVDVATPLNPSGNDDRWRLYISFGQAF